MRKVKYILVIAFLIIMSGKLDPVDSSASNHYNEGSASEEENIFYNVANSDEEFATDEWTYDPTVIDEARIERKAEAYAKETGKDVNEVKKSLLESAEKNRALYLAAVDAGVTVTEEEVTDSINEVKEVTHSDEEAEKSLTALLAGYKITEEEYWEKTRPQYRAILIINKYIKNQMEEKKNEGATNGDQELVEEISNEALKNYE